MCLAWQRQCCFKGRLLCLRGSGSRCAALPCLLVLPARLRYKQLLLGACRVDLEVAKRTGNDKQKWLVEKVEPVRARDAAAAAPCPLLAATAGMACMLCTAPTAPAAATNRCWPPLTPAPLSLPSAHQHQTASAAPACACLPAPACLPARSLYRSSPAIPTT